VTQPETPMPSDVSSESDLVSGPDVRVKLFARTDVGQVREHNEDNFLVGDLTRRSRGLLEANRATRIGPQGAVFAVCDGMGGAAAGEIASQLAVDILYERLVDGLDEQPTKRDDLARRLVHAVEAAGLRIFHEAKADRSRRGMGTTVTAAALVDDVIFFAQVGDSRGYILRGDQLVQVTRDQSLVNQLIEAGQLTEEEAETFEHNNIILQALGTSDTVQVDLTYVELRKGDILLLCSDGLSGMVRFDEIRELLKSSVEPLDICKGLTERANQAGGHDNITVIVVQFDGETLKPLEAPGEEAEPLKYRKYTLGDDTTADTAPLAAGGGNTLAQTNPDGSLRPAATSTGNSRAPGPWHEQGAVRVHEHDDRIDIPGTHVPIWMVVGIVVGVIVLLAGTAFLLLR
jgi:PPM family protein phosphatase